MYLTGKLGKLFVEKMSEHIYHDIELVEYGCDERTGEPENISLECNDCHELLIDADTYIKPKKRKKKA
jgi:hypothetical protein